MENPNPVTTEHFSKEVAQHGFFTREGGVSQGIYAGLNTGLGSNDDRTSVLENRGRVANHMGVEARTLLSPYQIHSSDVVAVHEPWAADYKPEVDALVTATPDLAIGIQTADCGPVLFLDPENRVAGAAHSGWKGATGGVLENTISAMETLGAERQHITAILGPTISAENYEVGPEFVERLVQQDSQNDRWFRPSEKPDHAMFDLPGYIVNRLEASGIQAGWTGHCTYADEDKFYSYRRKTHRGEEDYGRQISVITIRQE